MPVQVYSGVADSVEGAVVQVIELGCLASAAVNDFVYVSTTVSNFADVSTGNVDPRPVIGIIQEKITSVLCKVYVSGVIADPDANGPGVLYLTATGRSSITPPVANYRQKLGYSFGNGLIDLKPEKTLIFII